MSVPVDGVPYDTAAIPLPPKTDASHGERAPIFTGPFVLGWLINFAQYFVYYLLVTTLAVYAMSRFAASDAEGGLASSAFIIGATVMRLFAGGIVDALPRRRLLLIVLLIGCAVSCLYLVADTFAMLVAVRVLHGATFAIASTASMSLAQSVVPARRRAEGTGYLSLSSTVATAVGPALGLLLVGVSTYTMLFWCSLVIGAAGLVLALFVRDERDLLPRERRGLRIQWSGILAPSVVPIGLFMMLVGMSYAGIVTYLNGFAIERDLLAGAGFFFVAYAAMMFAGRLVLGRLQDRRGDNTVVYPAILVMAAAALVVAGATEDWHVVLSGALCGLGYGSLMPASQAIAVHSVPPERIGTGLSSLFLFTDIGFGICPALLGFAIGGFGYGWTFAGLAGVALLAGIWYVIVHGRHPVARRGRFAA
ncbi:MFS transporter [Salinibacterium sp. ZJ70]|uniref:MFS transporter n=1 Tax=Salinibacterium sp. ZJ70 TaxID=2708084 RepID=UPI001CD33F02|nr:MFS transporter [Salinibacterium sp. ZJ70]